MGHPHSFIWTQFFPFFFLRYSFEVNTTGCEPYSRKLIVLWFVNKNHSRYLYNNIFESHRKMWHLCNASAHRRPQDTFHIRHPVIQQKCPSLRIFYVYKSHFVILLPFGICVVVRYTAERMANDKNKIKFMAVTLLVLLFVVDVDRYIHSFCVMGSGQWTVGRYTDGCISTYRQIRHYRCFPFRSVAAVTGCVTVQYFKNSKYFVLFCALR